MYIISRYRSDDCDKTKGARTLKVGFGVGGRLIKQVSNLGLFQNLFKKNWYIEKSSKKI